MANRKKFYAIARGRIPGLYGEWNEAKKQVEGFSNACYKSFKTIEEAKAFLAKFGSGFSTLEVDDDAAASSAEAIGVDVAASKSSSQQQRKRQRIAVDQEKTTTTDTQKEYHQFAQEAAMYDRTAYVLQFDGGSRGNPGISGAGAVITDLKAKPTIMWSGYEYLGDSMTNNQAEYTGLLLGLKAALKLKITDLIIEGDSNLIVQQINGSYRVKSESLQPFHSKVMHLLPYFDYIINHIPRAQNAIADRLANQAMDTKQSHEAFGALL